MKAIITMLIAVLTFCNSAEAKNRKEPITDTFGTSKIKIVLKVIVLHTTDGILSDSEINVFKYPDKVAIDSIAKWSGKIAAYGASYGVWMGPAGWTGKGESGANGGTLVYLFPPGGKAMNKAYISYYEEPACVGCILSNAGQYFSTARKEYNKNYNDDGKNPIKIPDGLNSRQISSKIVTFTLPKKNGLITHGIAVYNGTEDYFEVKFVFPKEQSNLSDLLMNYYLSTLKPVKK